MGTAAGLNRYDSRRFIQYFAEPDREGSLENDYITALYEDETGQIWVGTQVGLFVYQPAAAKFVSLPDSTLRTESIISISGDRQGRVFVLTPRTITNLTVRLEAGRTHRLESLGARERITELSSVAVSRDGKVYVNTDRGVRTYAPSEGELYSTLGDTTERKNTAIEFHSTLYFDSANRIWVTDRGNGLRYFDPEASKWHRVPNLSSDYVNGVTEDAKGDFWICTGRNGLNILHLATGEVEVIQYGDRPENNFLSNSLSTIFSDRTGGIWIGSFNNGLLYHYQDQLKYELYFPRSEVTGISSNYITALESTENDDLWVGAGEEGLFFFDRGERRFTRLTPHDSDPQGLGEKKENFYIFSLWLLEREQRLLIGTLTGFYDYDIRKDTWHYVHGPTVAPNRMPGSVNVAMVQRGRQAYIGGLGGLLVYDLDRRTTVARPLPDPQDRIVSMVEEGDHLYIATRNSGCFRVSERENSLTPIRFPGVEPTGLRFLHVDHRGRWLISSISHELVRIDPDWQKVDYLKMAAGRNHLLPMAFCEDADGGYWMATNQGLAHISEDLELTQMLDQDDGFPPTYFTVAALNRSHKGEILVGGNAGLYTFNPENFYVDNGPNSKVHITDMLLVNAQAKDSTNGFRPTGQIYTGASVDLPKNQSVITLEFTALDYHNPTRSRYAYRLDPYDTEWNEVGNRNYATYRELPPGQYTFKVRYRMDHRDEVADSASLSFRQPPKPWQSPLAMMAYGLVFLVVTWQVFTHRRKQYRLRREVQMQKFEREKLQELHDFKIEFFTQITHELRTPLTLILGPVETILGRGAATRDGGLLRIIHRNTLKLLDRVNQILDFRKLEQLEMKVFAKKGNIVAFAEDVLNSFRELAAGKALKLIFNSDLQGSPYVLFDRDIMEKILVNLISNAIKFTEEGSISLSIEDLPDDTGVARYTIRVEDSGRGILPENLEKIFTTFFQEQRDDRRQGSGIGLKMVKQLTELHRGSIVVDSQPGRGTTFCLAFPRADLDLMAADDAPPTVGRARSSSVPGTAAVTNAGQATDTKLLIIDDEPDIREVIQEIFAGHFQTFLAPSAETGLKVARTEMPDLIICDVMMGGMDGFAFCDLAKSDFLLRHIPVVLLTALSATEHEIQGLRTGADAYVTKPFSPGLLRATVDNLIASRKQLKESFLNSGILRPSDLALDNTDHDFIERIIAFVDAHLDQTDLEVSQIAADLGVSSSTLYRKLKSLTDLSANEFVRTIRLKRSLEYLKTSDLTISEVSYRVGFSDPKYFSTCFRRLYHRTPSDYQAQQRGSSVS